MNSEARTPLAGGTAAGVIDPVVVGSLGVAVVVVDGVVEGVVVAGAVAALLFVDGVRTLPVVPCCLHSGGIADSATVPGAGQFFGG
jgi:hypothetical protein